MPEKFPSSNMTGSSDQKLLKALEMIYDRLGEILDKLNTEKEYSCPFCGLFETDSELGMNKHFEECGGDNSTR
jgi:hypothetical protein